jgi:hypothetical protein
MKILTTRLVCTAAASVAVLSNSLTPLFADQKIAAQFSQPVHATVNVNETGCYNNPGPKITIDGEVAIGGLQMRLILANNVKGTHTTVVTLDTNVVLVPLGTKITIPKQPVLGGVGGNPHIWLQFYTQSGNTSEEIYLGRCVQGLKISNDSINESVAALLISALGCENNPGPYIYFGGGMTLSGLNARLIFRNNLKGTHTAEWSGAVTLIPDGTLVKIPKQPVLGGSGGNPLVWVQLLQGDGTPIGDPEFLGRCNKL